MSCDPSGPCIVPVAWFVASVYNWQRLGTKEERSELAMMRQQFLITHESFED